ncbi:MAG: hypothetical protein ACODAB_09715 [Gemmatimonadota bacterium]
MPAASHAARAPILAFLTAAALAATACGDDDGPTTPEPTTGTLEVSASTTGDDLDPDGYTVTLDGSDPQTLAVDGSTAFDDVEEGEHQVELTGVADNCAVEGANPKTRTVTADETATATFDVVCAPTGGTVEVTTSTTGDTLDADGYVVTLGDSGDEQSVAPDGTVTFDDVAEGEHEVELSGIQPNCAADAGAVLTVSVTAGETAAVTFDVDCSPALFDRIVFASDRGADGVLDLWVMNLDGSDAGLYVETSDDDVVGDISPDGTRLAFQSSGTGVNEDDILVGDADGTGIVNITDRPTFDGLPAWSPDGLRIAFVADPDDDPMTTADLYVMDADGSNIVQVTDSPEPVGAPAWSPDGERIAFSQGTDGIGEVLVVNPDGSGLTNLTNGEALEGDPSWSPDGSRLAVISDRATPGSVEVFIMDADGSNPTRVTTETGVERWPTWSPDGTRIIYATDRSGDFDIHAVDLDGTGDTNLTSDSDANDFLPRAAPARD